MSKRKYKSKKEKFLVQLLSVIIFIVAGALFTFLTRGNTPEANPPRAQTQYSADMSSFISDLPEYEGYPWVVVHGNIPFFTTNEIAVCSDPTAASFESYAELDALGRCGTAEALASLDTMPTEERESISSVKPTGWVNNKYDTDLVDGGYLYNRCHLIGFQLTGENANEKNLITGTRAMNVDGMLGFENDVADYIASTGKPVLYRVTPIFVGDELVARGVLMEAYSVEDDGAGVMFCVYCFNIQPGITIDYATGENHLS